MMVTRLHWITAIHHAPNLLTMAEPREMLGLHGLLGVLRRALRSQNASTCVCMIYNANHRKRWSCIVSYALPLVVTDDHTPALDHSDPPRTSSMHNDGPHEPLGLRCWFGVMRWRFRRVPSRVLVAPLADPVHIENIACQWPANARHLCSHWRPLQAPRLPVSHLCIHRITG